VWKKYEVKLNMTGRFAASLPKTIDEIKNMLKNRMPTNPPPNYVPIEDLADVIVEEVGAAPESETEPEEAKYGWATFKRNDVGLYYEGRCIRGHLKDCANQIKDAIKPTITALKAKVSNKVYVMTEIIPLGTKDIAGTEQRFVQVMTRQGPRSTIKFIDYLEKPTLSFHLNVLDDGVITPTILNSIFEYGSVHGLGQERSQGWGRYTFTITEVK
jgi:hypothetical protein